MTKEDCSNTLPRGATLGDLTLVASSEASELTDRLLGKRGQPRTALSIPVRVRFAADDRESSAHLYTMHNISRTGISLYAHQPLPVDGIVNVGLFVNGLVWSGPMRILHCTETVGGYKVGLESMEEPEPSAGSESRPGPNECVRPLCRPMMEPATFSEIRAEIRKTIRAYHLARASWGLLGGAIRVQIRRAIRTVAGPSVPEQAGSRRKRPRSPVNTDTRVIFRAYHDWRQVAAWIIDVSEDGVGLAMPDQLLDDAIEREMVGDLHVSVGMTLIVGLGCEPRRLWIPGEVVDCSEPADGQVRAGIQFATPASLQIFST